MKTTNIDISHESIFPAHWTHHRYTEQLENQIRQFEQMSLFGHLKRKLFRKN